MKTPILLSVIIFLGIASAKAQTFAVVSDADGSANLREGQSASSRVIVKLRNNALVGIVEEQPLGTNAQWLNVYTMSKEDKCTDEGYIHSSRLKLLSSFSSIKSTKYGWNFSIAKSDSVAISVRSAKFIPRKHKLIYYTPSTPSPYGVKLIDGKQVWGKDGGIPSMSITSVSVNINGKEVKIPRSAYNDLYEPNYHTLKAHLAPDNTIYLEMTNGDDAGYYSIIWVIKDGVYVRRYIDNYYA